MYDLIVALGGGNDRKVKAEQLVTTEKVLFTGEPIQTIVTTYQNFGIPFDQAIIPPTVSANTIQDFQVIKAVMQNYKLTSVLIVDSAYHAPRSRMIAACILYPYFRYDFVTVPSPATKAQLFSEAIATIRNFITLKTGIQL